MYVCVFHVMHTSNFFTRCNCLRIIYIKYIVKLTISQLSNNLNELTLNPIIDLSYASVIFLSQFPFVSRPCFKKIFIQLENINCININIKTVKDTFILR